MSNQTIAQAEAQYRSARAVARGARADLFPTLSVAPSVSRSKAAASNFTPNLVAPTINYVPARGRRHLRGGRVGPHPPQPRVDGGARPRPAPPTSRRSACPCTRSSRPTTSRCAGSTASASCSPRASRNTRRRSSSRRAATTRASCRVSTSPRRRRILEATRADLTELALTRAQLEHAIAVLVGKPPAELSIAPVVVPLRAAGDPRWRCRRSCSSGAPTSPPPSGSSRPRTPRSASRRPRSSPTCSSTRPAGWSTGSLSRFFSAPNLFWSLGAALAQTIFEGGKRIAAKEQAIANYDASVAAYRQSVLTSFQDVENNLAALRLLAEEAEQQARAAQAAERR